MTTLTTVRTDPAEPPGIDATLRTFGAPVFGFVPQPQMAELAATTQTARARVVGVSLSYTHYRHPGTPDHPGNFVELTPEQNRAIERAESSALPRWMIDQVTRMRYPTLWDAVRTAKAAPGDTRNVLETRLVAHANDVLRARDPDHLPVRAPRATMTGRISLDDLLETTCVIVDGLPHRGRLLDAGAHLTALGARVDNRYLTVVYDTRIAPKVSLEFSTRRP